MRSNRFQIQLCCSLFHCDCPATSGNSAEDLAYASNICPNQYLVTVERSMSSTGGDVGFAVLESMGTNDCLVFGHGCAMTVLSTGPAGQANPNSAETMEGTASTDLDPQPPYQGSAPSTGQIESACDRSQLLAMLTVPSTAEGFSFDFLFASAEYDEWTNMGYNDTFYAIIEAAGTNGGQPTNIAFDDNGNEVEVDNEYFENASHPCDETGSGWEPGISSASGSTGWLRTSWPVTPGETISLTFLIHDEGDCVYDSIVFLDNFQWSGEPVDPGTVPIE